MIVNQIWQGGIRAIIDYDNTVFDNMELPEDIELADVVDHILYKYGDAPLFSPDPETIKFYIGRWSKRRLPLWERYKAAISTEYNPLENYDRHELETITYGKNIANTGTVTDTTSGAIVDTPAGQIKIENDATTTNTISADNSSNYEPDNQQVLDGEQNTSYDNYSETRSFNNYEEERALNTNEAASGEDEKDSYIHGNIGVTTSQQMLNQELDIIERLDLVDYIAADWHNEFCLSMYI